MKGPLFKGKRTFLWALKSGARTCYSFLKGVAIALYEFLEEPPEQPSPHADSAGLTPAGSGTTRVGGPEFRDALEIQDFGAAPENDIGVGGTLGRQGKNPLDRIIPSTQTESALDLATSVGFLRVEAGVPTEGGASGSPLDHGVTPDLAVQTCGLLASNLC